MNPTWIPECVVTAELARTLIDTQFPRLAPATVSPLGAGWDNTAFRVNSAFVFRFPRRRFAVPFLEAETNLMPVLAQRLPLPVPAPVFVGRPSDRYPWLFAGYRMLPGKTACGAALNDRQRQVLVDPLARFLTGLHAFPVAEALHCGAGYDTIAHLEPGPRSRRARDYLEQLARRKVIEDPAPLLAILESAPNHYVPGTATLVHGDLYARHLLLNAHHQLAGIIDWGDVHVGDKAVDLALVHLFLPPKAHKAFRQAYGLTDETTWRMARLRAVWHAASLLIFADSTQDVALLREGQRALQFLALA